MNLQRFFIFYLFTLFLLPKFAFSSDNRAYYAAEGGIDGPTEVCLTSDFQDVSFSTTEGDADTDVYNWVIINVDTGFELINHRGGPNYTFTFTGPGTFEVRLRIRRGDDIISEPTHRVVLERGPVFALEPDYTTCGDQPVTMQALNPSTPNFESYTIQWFGPDRTEISNENIITVTAPGVYRVVATSPVCEASASTVVGPPIEVEVTASETIACLGQGVSYIPDTPILANWSYMKDGGPRVNLGDFYELNLLTGEQLEGPGSYTIIFEAEDPNFPECPVQDIFSLEVFESPVMTLTKIQDSESCENPTGSFEILANTPLNGITVDGVPFGDLPAGGTLVVSDLEPGVATVTAAIGDCEISRAMRIQNENLDPAFEFTVESAEQTCTATGVEMGTITVTFTQGPQTGSYSFISTTGGGVFSGEFEDQVTFSESVPKGTYEVEVTDNDDCVIPSDIEHIVGGIDPVTFSIPTNINACEIYELRPESTMALNYTITWPDEERTESISSGASISLEESGTYEILAVDPSGALCPRLQQFNLVINEQIEYDYSFRQIDCMGNQMYTAELFGRSEDDVIIRWLNAEGRIVGRGKDFLPYNTGNYILDVQPRASSRCPLEPMPFTVVAPISETDVEILAEPLCAENAFTTLTVETDMDLVERIEWYVIDENGGREEIFEFENETSIDVVEGTYLVVVRNEIGCRLGSFTYEVERQPEIFIDMEETVGICPSENIMPTINPGEFAEYTWRFEGEVVSTNEVYGPTELGNYELEVLTFAGCTEIHEFEVINLCENLLRYPTALIVEEIEKDFRVYADPVIEEIEVFIYTRQGQLIFHCQSENTPVPTPLCIWKGLIGSQRAPVGTYPVIIRYRNSDKQIDNEVRSYLVIVGNDDR